VAIRGHEETCTSSGFHVQSIYISRTVYTHIVIKLLQTTFVRNCTPCQLLISSFSTSLTILCCLITVKPLNFGDSTSIAYMDPQPPLMSWTYILMLAIVSHAQAYSYASRCRPNLLGYCQTPDMLCRWDMMFPAMLI
jgi:hypothetical protein